MIHIISYHSELAHEIADLFHSSVHQVACTDYTREELAVWAPDPIDYDTWSTRLERKRPVVATDSTANNDTVLGFAELDPDGHIDCFYVHPEHQRRGVGRLLMNALEQKGFEAGLKRFFAEVSITARPFFERCGFTVIRPNLARRGDLTLKNYLMERRF